MIYGTGKICPKCGKLVTSHRHEARCGYRSPNKAKKWNEKARKAINNTLTTTSI